MDYTEILQLEPYGTGREDKRRLLTDKLTELTALHAEKCPPYARMLRTVGYDAAHIDSYEDLPFLPVRLFKEMELLSVEKSEVFKTMTSSGTTGQAVSRIFLDRVTAANQQKTLAKIVSSFTGSARMPMLIIDCPSVVKDRTKFSARGAGILGFSIFGADRTYALTDDMELDLDSVKAFLDRHKEQRILLFGFTFMIWQHFYRELLKLEEALDLSNGILIHGGGWKKLASEAVSPEEFHRRLEDVCGLHDIHE